jgi:hypothetical protein
MVNHLGTQYDTRNLFDLARYLLPEPPIPRRWRRHMMALGSGQPTRAICSTLIAQAFEQVRYPILPRVERVMVEKRGINRASRREILHIRHHSLYAPADFDVSPYFKIVKPTIEEGFNYKGLTWAEDRPARPAAPEVDAAVPDAAAARLRPAPMAETAFSAPWRPCAPAARPRRCG